MSSGDRTDRLLSSAGAATASQLWRISVTLATHMVLRRLILPDEMGVWNWAEPVFILLAQVRDLGLPGHLVRLQHKTYGAFLRLELLWGLVFCIGLALLAPLLALGFEGHDATTPNILRALCLFLFVQGLGAVPLTFFEVELKITRTIPAELTRNLCFAVLSIALALSGWGIWSIIVAHVTAAALYSVMLWWSAWGEIPLEYEGRVQALVTAALPLALMSVLELAVLYLDPLILGSVLPPAAVAKAALAISALFLVSRLIADAVGRAVYPALVSLRDSSPANTSGNAAFDLYRTATLFLATLVVPSCFVFHLNAELVALVLGGNEWLGAADYLRVAAFVPLVRPLTMFGRELLLSAHRDRLLLLYTLFNLVSLGGLGLALVATELGAIGMAVAGYFPLGTAFLAWGLAQLGGPTFRKLVLQLLTLYAVGGLVFAGVFVTDPEALAQRLILSAVAAVVFLALALWWRRDDYAKLLPGTARTFQ